MWSTIARIFSNVLKGFKGYFVYLLPGVNARQLKTRQLSNYNPVLLLTMGQALSFASFTGAAKKKQVVFQLGTNNWQRQGEFAPGSGILHEAHHDCMNSLDNTTCYSVYPSKGQKQSQLAAEEQTFVRIFPLEHDIPICESISPVSSYRWHSMSEEEFTAYRNRLRDFCIAFIDEIEAKEGQSITHAVAHHSFLNPVRSSVSYSVNLPLLAPCSEPKS